MNRILLADPNPILRSALALLLETRLEAQIVGQVSSLESLLCEAAATQPEIIIVGQSLPGEPSQAQIAALRRKAPYASIIISSTRPDSANLTDGITAILYQTDLPETILNTIQTLIQQRKPKEVCHV